MTLRHPDAAFPERYRGVELSSSSARADAGSAGPRSASTGLDRAQPDEPSPIDPEDFAGRVHELVAEIPPGRTMTYGEVAASLGSRASRVVGQVMARSGGTLPWWRVIRSGGHPPLGHEESARPHYEAEGTPLAEAATAAGYRVVHRRARWTPEG